MNLSGGSITLSAELVLGSSSPSPVAVSTPQSVAVSQTQQTQAVDALQPEVSLAEAARRNKATKAKDNPPPQQ